GYGSFVGMQRLPIAKLKQRMSFRSCWNSFGLARPALISVNGSQVQQVFFLRKISISASAEQVWDGQYCNKNGESFAETVA
ncbi:hypothetical protein A2U01_0014397, partial [Trifolium medium]|nr:hypothetical protein [Trifolium medium]